DQMLAADPAQRPSSMAQVKKHLEAIPYPHRPLMSYGLGLVGGTLFGLVILFLMYTGIQGGSFFWLFYIPAMFLNGIWQRIRKQRRLPKVLPVFVVLGLLTPLLFVLLFWLWQMF